MNSSTLKHFLLLAAFTGVLHSCGETQPVIPETQEAAGKIDVESAEKTSLSNEADDLVQQANESIDPYQQSQLREQAAHLYIDAGKNDAAIAELQKLKSVIQTRPVKYRSEKDNKIVAGNMIIEARLALAEKNSIHAAELINEINPITRTQQIMYHGVKADLDMLSGNYMYVLNRRVQLDAYFTNEADKTRNNRKIWAAVSSMSSHQLSNQKSTNPVESGWLDLARVMRSGQQNISQLENDLLDWGTRHPTHPVGQDFLGELIQVYTTDAIDRKQIAVILPAQGKLSTATATIRNGFLSAYYADNNNSIRPDIRFYDSSNENLAFYEIYEQAINDGASNIVGPINKSTINQLTLKHELDVPVLTLNYSEKQNIITDNLYQFGLSPEDEAQQVAELAIKRGQLRAAVYYPDSAWGKRLYKAFADYYTQQGGDVMTVTSYATTTNDYRRSIRTLFNLDQSDIRRRRVENIIGEKVNFEPYRRHDIDMVFLAATPHSARGIMPAFKFHHAGDLPVYSTSHVYSGKVDRELDRDLNGLTFCDLPWILKHDSPLNRTFKNNWPQQENYTRLFALGVDAYHLVFNLDYLDHRDYAFYNGETGNIQLDENNRVKRKLLWARFINGKPAYFEPRTTMPVHQHQTQATQQQVN